MKQSPEHRYYCPRCDRMVRITHEHSTRLIETEEQSLEPGWSLLTEAQIRRLKARQRETRP